MDEKESEQRREKTQTRSFGAGNRISHDASGYYESKLYSELPRETPFEEDQALPDDLRNALILADARSMKQIPDRSVHLMVTSPPYNVSKAYDEDLSLREYLELLEDVFRETHRVLVHGGRACINVANVGRKPYIPLSDHISHIMTSIGFLMRGEVIWNKGAGAGVSMAWGSYKSASNPVLRDVHEYILIFSKGGFGREAKGRENTITKEDFMEWTKSVWTMPTESAKKVGHPAPFPVELPRRLIELYTFKDDVILDPFMGSGSTALAALTTNRQYVGFEIAPEFAERARQRIDRYLQTGDTGGKAAPKVESGQTPIGPGSIDPTQVDQNQPDQSPQDQATADSDSL